jgi:signal transduction histidine kinase
VQLPRDDDGVVRRIPLLLRQGSACYPAFALQMVCEEMGVAPEGVRTLNGRIELWREGQRLARIPVDRDGCMLVDYRRRDRDAATVLPLARVAAGRADLERLRGRTVLLGVSARPLGQFHSTPLAPQVPDVAIHAEAVETILSGRFLQPARRLTQFAITWVFLFVGAWFMLRLPPWRGVLVGLALLVLYIGFEKAAFIWGGRWFDFMAPMAALQIAMVGYPLWSYRSRCNGLLDDLARLRRFDDLVLSTMTSGLLVADEDGRIIMSNPRAGRLLGFSASEDLDGRNLRQVFASSPTALTALDRAMAPADPPALGPACSLPVHVPVVRESPAPDGDRILDFSVSALDAIEHSRRPAEGRRYLLTFTDITERLRVAQEDERRARLAAIGEIAAKLGHEIRNSLGGLRLYVENVREEIDPKSAAGRAIDSMVDEIESLYRKIDELREYARDPILEMSECDLKQLVDEALAFSGRKLRDKHIQVVIEAQPKLEPVHADRRQIRAVFQNLINNAVEAAPENGRLHIGIERSAGGNGAGTTGNYVVHFEDDGPGIPPEIGEQVFSLFFTTKSDAGTGLGLSIVKKIVESHGGRVSYQSQPGQGTRFTVQLPPARRGEARP